MTVLQTHNLTKRYGGVAAVDHVSLTVEQGDIFGLIGQNGAGKSTLMRMAASLTHPDEGGLELFGQRRKSAVNAARKRMGCVVEMPALYPNLSARQNLEYYRLQRGIKDKSVVGDALERVGLTDTGKKGFAHFSLGMQQRLGLALAILNKPDFIILDEPINGLDPMGIIEMRELMKRLRDDGITILISSHILTELAQIANKYAIIHKGRLLQSFTHAQLRDRCRQALSIRVDDADKAAAILRHELNIHDCAQSENGELQLYEGLEDPAKINQRLVQGGVGVSSLRETGGSLEDYFTKMIGGEIL